MLESIVIFCSLYSVCGSRISNTDGLYYALSFLTVLVIFLALLEVQDELDFEILGWEGAYILPEQSKRCRYTL